MQFDYCKLLNIIQIVNLVFKKCPGQKQIISLDVNPSMETCVLPPLLRRNNKKVCPFGS